MSTALPPGAAGQRKTHGGVVAGQEVWQEWSGSPGHTFAHTKMRPDEEQLSSRDRCGCHARSSTPSLGPGGSEQAG